VAITGSSWDRPTEIWDLSTFLEVVLSSKVGGISLQAAPLVAYALCKRFQHSKKLPERWKGAAMIMSRQGRPIIACISMEIRVGDA
jgi:hypothetical protein